MCATPDFVTLHKRNILFPWFPSRDFILKNARYDVCRLENVLTWSVTKKTIRTTSP